MPIRALLVVIALAVLPACGNAQAGHLDIANLDHLSHKATETVNVTLGGIVLNIAARLVGDEDPEAREVLKGLDSIEVRSFEFDSDNAYSKGDVDIVRRQLAGPNWSRIVQASKREDGELVDVYVCIENQKPVGLAVIASEPRALTIVNMIGSIDIDRLARIQGRFGIPKASLTL